MECSFFHWSMVVIIVANWTRVDLSWNKFSLTLGAQGPCFYFIMYYYYAMYVLLPCGLQSVLWKFEPLLKHLPDQWLLVILGALLCMSNWISVETSSRSVMWPTLTEPYSAWLHVQPAQDLSEELPWKYVCDNHLVFQSACTMNPLYTGVIHGKIDTELLPCWNIILIHVSLWRCSYRRSDRL